MNAQELVAGDVLFRWKKVVWHRGVYMGNGQVLHNAPGPNDKGEHITTFADFAQGEEVRVVQPPMEHRAEILARAHQVVMNPQPYSHLWRNCEHTVYEVIEGEAKSPTVRGLVGIAALLGLAWLGYRYRKEIAGALKSAR